VAASFVTSKLEHKMLDVNITAECVRIKRKACKHYERRLLFLLVLSTRQAPRYDPRSVCSLAWRSDSLTKGKRRRGSGSRPKHVHGEPRSAGAGTCQSCGAALAPNARFCHRCGTPLEAAPASARSRPRRTSIVVYSVAVVSVVGATLAAALFATRYQSEPALPALDESAVRVPSTVDLSTMTPREAADRLFNRVMSASEGGDAEEAARFAPKAIAAYAQVTNLDADARYHLGLLHLLQDDLDQAREQIEILKQSVPRHLLALVLEHDVASRTGDAETAARAGAEFAAAYESEIATARPEYEAHKFSIDRFRAGADAPETGSELSTPAQPAAADGGAAVFGRKCAVCHGREAKGSDKGPPLVHKIYEPSHHADVAFYLAVRQGVRAHHWPFGDMPAVDGVNEEQIAGIVAYVRGLQKAAGIE
jgi:mono/diheme cytochrome c family protein/predicted nucleic acid-binding Zn ribbon protein